MADSGEPKAVVSGDFHDKTLKCKVNNQSKPFFAFFFLLFFFKEKSKKSEKKSN